MKFTTPMYVCRECNKELCYCDKCNRPLHLNERIVCIEKNHLCVECYETRK